jgi:hypothetical protein
VNDVTSDAEIIERKRETLKCAALKKLREEHHPRDQWCDCDHDHAPGENWCDLCEYPVKQAADDGG